MSSKRAKDLSGDDIGKTLSYVINSWDYRLKIRVPQVRESPITMITHKKDGNVNVRVGPSEGYKHQADMLCGPGEWLVLA